MAIIKHANPCGIAVGADVAEAHRKAHACDPVSAFGGVIAVNRPVTVELAEQVAEHLHRGDRRAVLRRRRGRGAARPRRTSGVLRRAGLEPGRRWSSGRSPAACWRRSADRIDAPGDDPANWPLATGEPADAETLRRPRVRLAGGPRGEVQRDPARPDGATVGVGHGPGQPGRLGAARGQPGRATGRRGSVAASDAFFPFADGLQILIDAGVRAVVQPGGSIRDEEVIAAAKAAGVTMYLTGTRHFFH